MKLNDEAAEQVAREFRAEVIALDISPRMDGLALVGEMAS